MSSVSISLVGVLRSLRKEKGLTLVEVSERLKKPVSVALLGFLETGKKTTTPETAMRVLVEGVGMKRVEAVRVVKKLMEEAVEEAVKKL